MYGDVRRLQSAEVYGAGKVRVQSVCHYADDISHTVLQWPWQLNFATSVADVECRKPVIPQCTTAVLGAYPGLPASVACGTAVADNVN